MIDDYKNQVLKQKLIEAASNPNFRHHSWFVKYHLEIVEKIANELCEIYTNANKLYVAALLWLHDYEKIVDFDNQYNTELVATKNLMADIGYSAEVIDDICASINRYNAKQNLASDTIEVQIVSSADAASHFVGPFTAIYWHENPTKSIGELQNENKRKIAVDWNSKITLPEVKVAFESRHKKALEIAGDIPATFIGL